MNSLDKFLADLDAVDQPEYRNINKSKPENQGSSKEQLLADLAAIDQPRENNQNAYQAKINLPKSKDPNLETLLSQVKLDYEQKELAELEEKEFVLYQQQLAIQKQEEANKKRREKQAQKWLRALDPLTTEGIWFTDFARNYPSVLEAAIDYLAALERI